MSPSAQMRSEPPDSRSALIGQAQSGDVRAFEALYREHAGPVYGLCLRLSGNRASAEDFTQETFINAWRALARFEAKSSFRTWLHRIAVNVVMHKRRKRSSSEEPIENPEDYMAAAWQFETPVEMSELEAAIGTLPDGARHTVVLSGIYGYSHQEIAEMLGVAEGTCRAQLHRARKLLRERLQVEIA